ncbi:MAG TPA: 23S rRNA (adenine(2030)-N(6))-methyltransferase RlmJ [Micropepsaceae bacterium]|nr:23S rRNA (adenine(2030)-N(6))-methyltransferase RlmJ [Micropepsaceae bacterium]
MNYRHAYHAGNFADVVKHAALVSVLLHLKKKDKPFAVIDTHAGRGIYDTASTEAQKTGEAADGIGRLLAQTSVPGVLKPYVDVVRSFGEGRYPGSPLIAARLLRSSDRLVAVEFHPDECDMLKKQLAGVRQARVLHTDGYRELPRLLPPPEHRAVVLIDPPYEREDEFAVAAQAVIAAHRRFATGIYLLWYPAKLLPLVSATCGELLNAGIRSALRMEIDVGAKPVPPGQGRGPAMTATGLLVVNPPYGFSEEMHEILPFLSSLLGQGPGASHLITPVAEGK